MQLKKIFRKTELHLMSIRSKHQKLHHAVWNKYGKNSVHSVIHKWEMENYDLTQERCSCVLFMCCLYMHIFSIQPNTVLVYFIFKYIKKKPSVFPYHFIISEIWHPKNTKITGCLTEIHELYYSDLSQNRYSQYSSFWYTYQSWLNFIEH